MSTKIASQSLEMYGPYPIARTFALNDQIHGLSNSTMPGFDSTIDADASAKRHSACDECRKRKLKCSGETTGCTRCMKQSLVCHYSLQKQMGRPRKRTKLEDTTAPETNSTDPQISVNLIDPELTEEAVERTTFENICTGPISQHIRRAGQGYRKPNSLVSSTSSSTSPLDGPKTPPDLEIPNISYPLDISSWPDFSDITLPVPVQERHEQAMAGQSEGSLDPDADPSSLMQLPATPECPCLPNMYLTLSTLSSLSAFPVSTHTIDTLMTSHRTARSVLYCSICPQRFQSGSQNVMLSSTLLNVLADQWHRVLRAAASDLRQGFGNAKATREKLSIHDELEWRTFAHNLVQAHVFGRRPIPNPPAGQFSSTGQSTSNHTRGPTLWSLGDAMERRQREWHGLDPWTGEFPQRFTHELAKGHLVGMTLEEIERCQNDSSEHLCLKIVTHSQSIIKSLDKPAPTI